LFYDPAGQFQFQLPLDWAYDPVRSDLRMLVFARSKPQTETLVVTSLPTSAPPNASAEEWTSAVVTAPRRYPVTAVTKVRCNGGIGIMAAGGGDEESTGFFRELTIRGPRLDFAAEHRVSAMPMGSRASDTLPVLCRTVGMLVNERMPEDPGEATIAAELQRAHQASSRQARIEVIEAAERVRRGAVGAYLHGNVTGIRWPEIGAVLYLIDALMLLGATVHDPTTGLVHLRDAERLTLRAQASLQAMPFSEPGRRDWLQQELRERLKIITDLHVTTTGSGDGDSESTPLDGYGLAYRRVTTLLSRMLREVRAGDLVEARLAAETAVADLLTLLHVLRGIEAEATKGPESGSALHAAAGRTILEQERGLAAALGTLSYLDLQRGNVERGVEASGLLEWVARDIVAGQNRHQDREDAPVKELDPAFLAYALIDHARNLAWLGDIPHLEQAQSLLDEAARLLDESGEEGAYRAQLSIALVDVAYKRKDLEGVRTAATRGLIASANDAVAASTATALRRLMTLVEAKDVSDLDKARGVLQGLLGLPEPTARERLLHASYYLDLADVNVTAGNLQTAREDVREALRRILPHHPLGEESIRAFQTMAQLSGNNEFPLAFQARIAAMLAFEARRTGFYSEDVRLALGEVQGNRVIYEEFVEWLLNLQPIAEATVAAKSGGPVTKGFPAMLRNEALAVADRARSQLLNEILALTTEMPSLATDATDSQYPVPNDLVSNFGDTDVVEVLSNAAAYVISSANAELVRRGTTLPLQSDEVKDLARSLAAPVLLIQPAGDAVRLMVLLSSGEITTVLSPLPFSELLVQGEALRDQLHIFSVPRGTINPLDSAPVQDIDELAKELWQALIDPLASALPDDGPLILVPFGPIALLPFALLRNLDGQMLIDRYDLSVSPSLGTLRWLRQRGAWNRERPERAYIVGDPALADQFKGLKPLPGARAEASALAKLLLHIGVEPNKVHLRLGAAAHEESYRAEASGCDLVHIAAHAELKEPAYSSRLYLAGEEDGTLLAAEVAEVELDDALVFLSACETGQGRPTAEGVVGFGYSFLKAGARAVVLSLWKVDDNATSSLARHFYRTLLDNARGVTAAAALREAMAATRRDLAAGNIVGQDGKPLDDRPAHWAPFLILGDGQAIQYGGDSHEREPTLGD